MSNEDYPLHKPDEEWRKDLAPEHGGPARLLVPHWICRRCSGR